MNVLEETHSATPTAPDARVAKRFELVVQSEERPEFRVPIEKEPVTIGRASDNLVQLDERNISRHHLAMRLKDDHVEVEELGSSYGTLLNGKKLEGAVGLQHGDSIRVGDVDLTLDEIVIHPDIASITDASHPPIPSIELPVGPLPSSDQGRLIVLEPEQLKGELLLDYTQMLLGRSEQLSLTINHRSISREHAEFRCEDGQFRVIDLQSANGTRINGRDIRDANLRHSDIVEFGQVRTRFLYSRHADTEASVVAPPDRRSPRLWWPWVAGALGVVLLLAAAVPRLWAAWERSRAQEAFSGSVVVEADAAPETQADLLEQCKAALTAGRTAEAKRLVQTALTQDPRSKQALACRDAIAADATQEALFQRGKAAFDAGQYDEAQALFAQLDADSAQARRKTVHKAAETFARIHLASAQALLKKDSAGARQEIEKALAVPSLSAELHAEAVALQHKLDQADSKAPNGARAQPPRKAVASRPRPTPARPAKAPEEQGVLPADCDPIRPDYSACLVRTLEGKAKSPGQLALLIESYRQLKQEDKARKRMATFVRRYPDHRLSLHYREVLGKSAGKP